MNGIKRAVLAGAFLAGAIGVGSYGGDVPCTIPEGARAGELSLSDCTYTGADGVEYVADCGTWVVPENRSGPGSRPIALPVVRVRAVGADPTEPIFWLSGGPGSSNMQVGGIEPFLEHHDVVMIGYRGVDGSVVLDCPEVAVALKNTGGDLASETAIRRYGEALARCAAAHRTGGVDIAGYNVVEVVEDMESARIALGYDRIDLLSASYGTRLAQYYAHVYPDSLYRSAMVSVNPPGHFVWEPAVLDSQIEYDATLCAADPDCSARTRDLAETMRTVSHDMPTRWLWLPIDPGKVRFMTHFMLYHRGSAAMAYDAYIAAEQGDPSGLAVMSLMFDQMLPASVAWGEWAAKGGVDYEMSRDWTNEMGPSDSILGSPLSLLAGGGAVLGGSWPAAPVPAWVHEPQPSDVETLLVGGSIDFSTPAQFATDELLPLLSNGRQVVLAEMGHTNDVFGLQSEAMFHLLSTFYDTGEVDDSLFAYQPMDFDVEVGLPEIAHAVLNAVVGVTLLVAAALVVLF